MYLDCQAIFIPIGTSATDDLSVREAILLALAAVFGVLLIIMTLVVFVMGLYLSRKNRSIKVENSAQDDGRTTMSYDGSQYTIINTTESTLVSSKKYGIAMDDNVAYATTSQALANRRANA